MFSEVFVCRGWGGGGVLCSGGCCEGFHVNGGAVKGVGSVKWGAMKEPPLGQRAGGTHPTEILPCFVCTCASRTQFLKQLISLDRYCQFDGNLVCGIYTQFVCL